jgi:Rhs element Vgr protein
VAHAARWHGLVTAASAGIELAGGWQAVAIRLEPEFSLMRGLVRSRILLGNSPLEAVADAARASGVSPGYLFSAGGAGRAPRREFAFQHREDTLRFVMRILEREGLSLAFDQTGRTEVAVLRDGNAGFPDLIDPVTGDEAVLRAVPPAGLGTDGGALRIFGLSPEIRVPAASVRLREYDWKSPARNLDAERAISAHGKGEIYLYGENFSTDSEGRRLASLRAEEELWASERLTALTREPGVMPGVIFSVSGSEGLDGSYLVAETAFSGSQAAAVASGLGADPAALARSFAGGGGPEASGGPDGKALPEGLLHRLVLGRAARTYRPRRVTPVPEAGMITARIDGAGTDGMPEMDWAGRYRVSFPQELVRRAGGKASHWIRMAQPYVGAGYGQNFPLSPGVEVLLAFEGGDPDRPVIVGAVPDAATVTPVTSEVPPMSGLATRGGSSLMFGEEQEKQHLTLSSGAGGGLVSISAGSPTVASFHAQAADVNTVVCNSNSLLASCHGAGFKYEIDTRRKLGCMRLASFMAAAASALELGSDVAGVVADYTEGKVETEEEQFEETEKREKKYTNASWLGERLWDMTTDMFSEERRAGTVSDIFRYASILAKLVEVGYPGLLAAYEAARQMTDVKKGAADTHLFTLEGAEDGAVAVWQCKPPFKMLSASGMPTFFISLMNVPQAATGGTPSAYASILPDFITTFILVLTLLSNSNVPARGILISDTASYVSFLSNSFGTFSSRGPMVLESGGTALMGDDLRFNKLRARCSTWDSLVEPDRGKAANRIFMSSRSLLLRGKLVRTFCEELSLTATRLVTLESPGTVRLASGPMVEMPLGPQVSSEGAGDALASLVRLDPGPAIVKGISVEVLPRSGEGAAARMCCFDGDGAVQLLQGEAAAARPAPGVVDGRRLELGSKGVLMMDSPDRLAVMDEGDGVCLGGGDSADLKLKGSTLSVTGQQGGVKLGSGTAGMSFVQNFKASVAGASEITAGPTGLVMKAPASADISKAVLINFDK